MVDSSSDDFERSSDQYYAIGKPNTILNYKINDPRKPQIEIEDVKAFPVYIRLLQIPERTAGMWTWFGWA